MYSFVSHLICNLSVFREIREVFGSLTTKRMQTLLKTQQNYVQYGFFPLAYIFLVFYKLPFSSNTCGNSSFVIQMFIKLSYRCRDFQIICFPILCFTQMCCFSLPRRQNTALQLATKIYGVCDAANKRFLVKHSVTAWEL